MKQILIRSGNAIVSDVPAPQVGTKEILVRVAHSCISIGTEMQGVAMSGLPLYKRALKQPENVKRVIDMAREQGLKRTMDRVSGKLAAGSATGYSAAGIVVAVGDDVAGFAVGDRVACAGAGIANHAEVISVPVNLAVRIPAGLGTDFASSVTLGAIAMQGVRRSQPTLGETFVVVGLGILGQITAQILTANGCHVIGVDIDPARIQTAVDLGMAYGIDPRAEDYVARVVMHTEGMGADGVIITAATSSNEVISEAMRACRKKGRVVLVGDVGLNLKRADFYRNELDFLISCSYGPGRYDSEYEENGQDYPIGYVRWTENRNMQAYIALLEAKKVRLDGFFGTPYPVERAGEAYESLKNSEAKPLMVLLSYPDNGSPVVRRVEINHRPIATGRIRVALAGASSFAQGVHLPNIAIMHDRFEMRAVMSRTGANARAVATASSAAYCTTDYAEILNDPDVDLVLIATRHNLHAEMALAALRAGKHVFVEKPLSLTEDGLDAIEQFYANNADGPVLMTGFNRRFAPAISQMHRLLIGRVTPIMVDYRMNAGFIPSDHWVHGPEGGGRNLGEACHIYDLFGMLCGAAGVRSVSAHSIVPQSAQWHRNDNFAATIAFDDGSICTLTYSALGSKAYPKERMTVFADGKALEMDDFKSVTGYGTRAAAWSSTTIQKGQREELAALAETLKLGAAWPISLAEQLQASRIALEVERQIHI